MSSSPQKCSWSLWLWFQIHKWSNTELNGFWISVCSLRCRIRHRSRSDYGFLHCFGFHKVFHENRVIGVSIPVWRASVFVWPIHAWSDPWLDRLAGHPCCGCRGRTEFCRNNSQRSNFPAFVPLLSTARDMGVLQPKTESAIEWFF